MVRRCLTFCFSYAPRCFPYFRVTFLFGIFSYFCNFSFRISSPTAKESKSRLLLRMDKINQDMHVKKSFGKLITEDETRILAEIAKRSGDEDYQGDYWLPLQWSMRILKKAREVSTNSTSSKYYSNIPSYANDAFMEIIV